MINQNLQIHSSYSNRGTQAASSHLENPRASSYVNYNANTIGQRSFEVQHSHTQEIHTDFFDFFLDALFQENRKSKRARRDAEPYTLETITASDLKDLSYMLDLLNEQDNKPSQAPRKSLPYLRTY